MIDADLRLALSVRRGAFNIRKIFCGRAEKAFGALAMWAPEGAVEDHALLFYAHCEVIVLTWLGLDQETRSDREHNYSNDNAPENKYAFLH